MEVVYFSLMEVVSQSRSLGGNRVKITSLQHSAAAEREAGDSASMGATLASPALSPSYRKLMEALREKARAGEVGLVPA